MLSVVIDIQARSGKIRIRDNYSFLNELRLFLLIVALLLALDFWYKASYILSSKILINSISA